MSTLKRFQEWFAHQCDGTWEHNGGISIETCDNPGWWVKIELSGTVLEGSEFPRLSHGIGADGHPDSTRWIDCKLEGTVWHGAGDETKLEKILATFLSWTKTAGG